MMGKLIASAQAQTKNKESMSLKSLKPEESKEEYKEDECKDKG